MITVKELKGNRVAIILGEGYKELALQVVNKVTSYMVGVEKEKEDTFADIVRRVECAEKPRLSLNTAALPPKIYTAHRIDGLGEEKAASEVLSVLYDKMIVKNTAQLRVFYTDLEREMGVGLSEIHKNRLKCVDKNEAKRYPYRKIDTVLQTLGKERVYTYAKNYEFKEAD